MAPPPSKPLNEEPTKRRKTGVVLARVHSPPRCASCSAPVIWAVTPAGKRMPVDVQLSIAGNLVLCYEVDQLGRPVSGQQVIPAPPDYAGPRWASHFASCPQAALWQRRSALRGEL
ncbi:MAG: hypothetical protein ACJ8GN_02000 [Longimicrobiaceae bacterium]